MSTSEESETVERLSCPRWITCIRGYWSWGYFRQIISLWRGIYQMPTDRCMDSFMTIDSRLTGMSIVRFRVGWIARRRHSLCLRLGNWRFIARRLLQGLRTYKG